MYTLFSRHATDQAPIYRTVVKVEPVQADLFQLVYSLADLQELSGRYIPESLHHARHRPLDGQLVDGGCGANADELSERARSKAATGVDIHVYRSLYARLAESRGYVGTD